MDRGVRAGEGETARVRTGSAPNAHSPQRLGRGAMLGFGVGSIASGLYISAPGVLLLFYATDVLGVAAGFAALVVTAPKLLGMLSDPLIGAASDRTRTPWGRRRPFMLVGALILAVGFAGVFNTPLGWSVEARGWWLLGAYALSALGYSIFAVPYITLPAELSADPFERTRIISYRMSFVMVGVLIGSAASPALVEHWGGTAQAYARMGLAAAAAAFAAVLASVAAVREPAAPERQARPFRGDLAALWRDRFFRPLVVIYGLQTVAVSLVTAMLPYAARWLLGAGEGLVGLLLLAFLLATLAGLALWDRLAARWGKRRCLLAAVAGFVILTISLAPLSAGYPMGMLIAQFAGLGLCYAAMQLLPFSMVTDIVRLDAATIGAAREGVFTGAWTAAEKLALGLGAGAGALILASFGYVSGEAVASQPDSALAAIRGAFLAAPIVLQAAGLALLWRYREPAEHA